MLNARKQQTVSPLAAAPATAMQTEALATAGMAGENALAGGHSMAGGSAMAGAAAGGGGAQGTVALAAAGRPIPRLLDRHLRLLVGAAVEAALAEEAAKQVRGGREGDALKWLAS